MSDFYLETFDDKVDFPDFRDPIARHYGTFIMAWGVLERELNLGFAVVFRVHPHLSSSLCANLGTKGKVDVLQSAISTLEMYLGTRLTAGAHRALAGISDESEMRNTLAHGQPEVFIDVSDVGWELVKHTARKRYSMILYPNTPAFWAARTRNCVRLAKRWRKHVVRIHRKLIPLTPEQIEDLPLDVRYAQPALKHPRKRRLLKPSGSKARQASRG
jgi:hypothetical protein